MALQYGVPLITLVDKFRHARFEPAGMTSNKNIPFAKSLIDYIFCWLGCRFIPGYAEKNTPSGTKPANIKTKTTTAKQLVEKTKDLAKIIDVAKALQSKPEPMSPADVKPSAAGSDRFTEAVDEKVVAVIGSIIDGDTQLQSEATIIQQLNDQFQRFQDDAPACDICGAITVRNGTCYRCHNCGNSMGCS